MKNSGLLIMNRSSPQKTCPVCKNECHARCSSCACGHQFYIKQSEKQRILAENWRDLKSGDIIKCISGSGPYFLSKDRAGERIMMGVKGKFQVVEINDNGPKKCGIIALQIHGRRTANVRDYIYMGESCYDESLGIYREPHKIKVIKQQNG